MIASSFTMCGYLSVEALSHRSGRRLPARIFEHLYCCMPVFPCFFRLFLPVFLMSSKLVERLAGQACAEEGVRCNSILAAVTGMMAPGSPCMAHESVLSQYRWLREN